MAWQNVSFLTDAASAEPVCDALLELGYRQMDIPGANLAIVGSEPPGPRLNYACGMAFAATVLEHHSQHYDDALLLDVVDAMRRDYIK